MSTLALPYLEKCLQNDGFFVEKKCPIFCGSIFSQILRSAIKLASLAKTSSQRVKMVRFSKILLCGEAHFFRAKIAPKKVQVVLED